MQYLNSFNAVGRLTKDPEIKAAGEKRVCNFTLAINKNANDGSSENADFIPCVAWNKCVDWLAYGKKGSLISVQGKLRSRSYEKDGKMNYVVEVMADTVVVLNNKADVKVNE
ncbi:single-stranded DNA-binding protein [Dielma fastidiosa]|uniref:single-stranded DNA-binding protein n=1 Tax=Dielma fastidiosa TaxID=1034346 RepID=UPI0023F45995|nr:single-stranded DNA-binding protein [Dielma fastidiosa]